MKLVNEKLMQPAFLQSEFERNQKNAIQGAINAKKDASYLASTAFRQLVNTDNIAAMPSAGNEKTLKNITLNDLKSFYATQIKPAGTQVIAVSDLDKKAIVKQLSIFEPWKGKSKKLALALPEPTTKTGVIYLVNKDGAAQSAISIGKRSIKKDIVGEYYKAYLMNFPLGGAFNSRINLNLREEKGYTYGARSSFTGDKLSGVYAAGAEVRADVTDKSIVEFIKEIKNYAENGITDEELSFMRKSVNQKDALKYETPRAKLGFLAQMLEHNLTADFVKTRATIVDTITKDEINALAKKHLNINDMIIVVVGDEKKLRPQLEALGYEVVDYKI